VTGADRTDRRRVIESARRSIERVLLGGDRRYRRDQVLELAGVPFERGHELWRALGFSSVSDDAVVFTDGDVEALRTTYELISSGLLDPAAALSTARMQGQFLSRLAEWQVSLLQDVLAANPELAADERQLVRLLERLIPDQERLQNYVWRRHLAAYAGRTLAAGQPMEAGNLVVGFADMVGFTRLTRRSDEADLIQVVDLFDTVTAEVVSEHGGRIVKMIGDEVLFVADTPARGAEVGLRLVERAESEDGLPPLRAGLAYGRVLSRFGDVYGSVVNIAARLTSVARPGTILVDVGMADALTGESAFTLRSRRPVSVRGFARLKPSVLRRTGPVGTPHIPLEPADPPIRSPRRNR